MTLSLHAIILSIVAMVIVSTRLNAQGLADEVYLSRMAELHAHPNGAMRKRLEEKGPVLAALDIVQLTDSQKQAIAVLQTSHTHEMAAWEAENGAELKQVFEDMLKYRHTSGTGHNEKYEALHKRKVELSQSKPKLSTDSIAAVLDDEKKKAFNAELKTLEFWYGSHGDNARIMRLIEAGADVQRAKALYREYVTSNENTKKLIREGKARPDALIDFLSVLDKAKAPTSEEKSTTSKRSNP